MYVFFAMLIASAVLVIVKGKDYRKALIGIMASLIVFCCGCSSQGMAAMNQKSDNTASAASASGLNKKEASSAAEVTSVSGKLKIHYIDVEQGDSILIQQDGRNMLIDTGTNASTDTLINYLHSQSINKIDYLILTHAHEDHIGGADAVIRDFDIGTIYMTKYTSTTKTYRDVISAMKSKGLKATLPVLGNKFNLGQASCTILGPVNPQGEDLNTCSIVIKLTFGSTKFLFTGDAQASNEETMINNKYDLSADVLKVGHHGSHTSTCQQFLDAVNPKYAVISAGKGNDYGHPHKETMDRLRAKGVKVYRTDESGTIICISDGKNISFSCKPGDYKYGSQVSSEKGRKK